MLLVDCDPQCNLTGLVLEYDYDDDYPFETPVGSKPKNIRDAVEPAFEGRPKPIVAPEVQPISARDGLFLLPGHVGLSEYESRLAIAHDLSSSLATLQNIPGALHFALSAAAEENKIDFVLLDLSPSLGALNQNLLMGSDGFVVPMAPDFFSSMALRSLADVLPKWAEWSVTAGQTSSFKKADYPWAGAVPKLFGTIVQNYRKRARDGGVSRPTRAFQKWFDDLAAILHNDFYAALDGADMLLSAEKYELAGVNPKKFTLEVSDFNGLIAVSQDLSKPVFDLTQDDIRTSGSVASNQMASVRAFNQVYGSGADELVAIADVC